MTVLIVDDQPSVVSGILLGVNWRRCGVSRVVKANSANEARMHIRDAQPDILLLDVEMPGESGLDLLAWMRENECDAECILLTAHADFDYAQRALQLGSFDYILQPAPYERIEHAIIAAMERRASRREAEKYCRYGQMFYEKRDRIAQLLLSDWFNGRCEDYPALCADLRDLGVLVEEETLFLCGWLRFNGSYSSPDSLTVILESLLRDTMQESCFHVLICPDAKGGCCMAAFWEGAQRADVPKALGALPERIRDAYGLDAKACWARELVGARQVPETLKALAMQEGQPEEGEIGELRLDANLPSHALCRKAMEYFDALEAGGRKTSERVDHSYAEFLRTLDGALAHEGFLRDNLPDMDVGSGISMEEARLRIARLEQALNAGKDSEDSDQALIQIILRYIRANIDQDIRRTDIASVVYLSPSYISRIFREHMGMPLKEFIIQEKMKLARTLICSTHLPISVIATKVGYGNFSHFSQTYKRQWGVSPSAEREGSVAEPPELRAPDPLPRD